MPGQRQEYELQSGERVALVEWNGLKPTRHGDGLRDTPWTPESSRNDLRFYDATNEYMRNHWAFSNMPNRHVTLEGKDAVLFYHAKTDSWHTTDALDIDHKSEWKQHLQQRGVANMAEANMAYNDADNLRLLPSSYNRARDSADRLYADKDQKPDDWNAWRKSNFGYDPAHPPVDYNPVQHKTSRSVVTLEQDYDPGKGRKGLSFDDNVKSIWFESQLKTLYAGSVEVPKGGDSRNGVEQVPLFRCPQTHQLVTRDAFDIDHRWPISDVLKEKIEQSPEGKISKADALDAYNDVSNLRLIVRSANCSHEWELDRDGQFADAEHGPKPKSGARRVAKDDDLSDFIVEDDIQSPENRLAFQALREHLDRNPKPLPTRDPSEPLSTPNVKRAFDVVADTSEPLPKQDDPKRQQLPNVLVQGSGASAFSPSGVSATVYTVGDPRNPNDPGHNDYLKVKAAVDGTHQYGLLKAENIAVAAYLEAAADKGVRRFDDVRVNNGVVSVSYAPNGMTSETAISHHTRIADVQDKSIGQSLQEARTQALPATTQPSDPQIVALSQPASPKQQ
jgi:hypothetical protein